MDELDFLVENGYCDDREAAERVYGALSEGLRRRIADLIGSSPQSRYSAGILPGGTGSKRKSKSKDSDNKLEAGEVGLPSHKRAPGAKKSTISKTGTITNQDGYIVDKTGPKNVIHHY
jgi:hypothetical protein